MTLELIGMIGGAAQGIEGGTVSIVGSPDVDPAYIQRFARAHEEGGFDTVLVGYGSTGPDGWSLALWGAAGTDRLKFLLAHRPGFVAPTLAARKAATVHQLTGGRIALHIITGGSDAEMRRDGDFHDKDTRYRRTDEYLTVLRKTWTSDEPFDYEGEFYRLENAFSGVKPAEPVVLFFGGSSDAAFDVGAKHADVWATFGEPVETLKQQIARIRSNAAVHGRSPEVHVSLRVILGSTEDRAWERAADTLNRIRQARTGVARVAPPSAGGQRLLAFAERQEVYDTRLWTAIAAEIGANSNSMTLVGTPDQVAESLVAYWEAGVSHILIRGFDPLDDAIEYGRDLVPVVRKEVAKRERALAGAL